MINLKLIDIVEGEDFQREPDRAANLSYVHNAESGFCVWTDDQYKEYGVNAAALGDKNSMFTDMSQNKHLDIGMGYYIPMNHYRMVDVHFHPPNTNLKPSFSDIEETIASMNANIAFRDSNSEYDRSVFSKDGEFIGTKVDYILPISFIGMRRNNSEGYGLILYQALSTKIRIYKFYEFIAQYCNEKYNTEFTPEIFACFPGIPTKFNSPRRMAELLNLSGQFKSDFINSKRGRITPRSVGKIKQFKIIKTEVD